MFGACDRRDGGTALPIDAERGACDVCDGPALTLDDLGAVWGLPGALLEGVVVDDELEKHMGHLGCNVSSSHPPMHGLPNDVVDDGDGDALVTPVRCFSRHGE